MNSNLSASISNLIMDAYLHLENIDIRHTNTINTIDMLDYLNTIRDIIHVIQNSNYDMHLVKTVANLDPMFDKEFNQQTPNQNTSEFFETIFKKLNDADKQTYVKIQQLTKQPLFNHPVYPPLKIK